MRILVTGANGQLGYDVVTELCARGHEVIATGTGKAAATREGVCYFQMQLEDEERVREVFASQEPEAVIHCAAWTEVDAAEEPENYDRVNAVNVQGTALLAKCCEECGSRLLYVSTDYVFSGDEGGAYQPDASYKEALTVYGRTKYLGEQMAQSHCQRCFVVRTSWSFGMHGKNFVRALIGAAERLIPLKVVSDQIGRPTYTEDLARLLADMIVTDRYGTYHASNEGEYVSRYEYACEIFRQLKWQTSVMPVTTEEYGNAKTRRPKNSRLDTAKLTECGFTPLPDWKDALRRYLVAEGWLKNCDEKGKDRT